MRYKARHEIGVLTYSKALERLGSREEQVIAGNTKLVIRDDGIALRHWFTDIITYHPDGSISLIPHNSVTTRTRYNAHLDNRVWVEDGSMFIDDSRGLAYEFYEELTIKADGTIDHTPYMGNRLEQVTGKSIHSWDDLIQAIASLSLDEMTKVWNKLREAHRRFSSRNYRVILAKYCTEKFLPLIIAQGDGTEAWRSVAAERLRI